MHPVLLLASILLATPTPPAPRVVTAADLAPIPLGEDDAAARSLIARRQWKQAAAKINARTPEARLVRGWVLAQAKDHAGTLAALEGLEKSLPLLADKVRILRGEALLAQNRFPEALEAVAALGADDAAGRMARRIRARALRESGRLEESRAEYQRAIDSGRADEVPVGLLGLARLESDEGRPARAMPLLRRIDVEFPAHWTAGSARQLAGAIGKADRKLRKAYEQRAPEEEVARAEKLMDRHRNKEVVDALDKLTKKKLPPDLACRQRYALGRSLRKLRQWEKARPILEEAVTRCEKAKSDLAPWARYLAGQAAERLSKEEEAAEHYRRQLAKHPDHRLADDAGYELVRHLVQDKDDFAGARKQVEKLVKSHPGGDMVPEAIFFVALHAMLKGKDDVARAVLALEEKLAPRKVDYADDGRTRYWLARLDHRAGKEAAAVEGYRRVLVESPFRWYSILAYSRLREIDSKVAKAAAEAMLARRDTTTSLPAHDVDAWAFTLPPDVQGPAWERAVLLARLGLAEPAWTALQEVGAGRDRGDVLWLSAWILDRAGAYNLSHDLLRRRLPEFRDFPPTGHTAKHWHIAFPDPYPDLMDKMGKAEGVDPFLIRAIIREESGFNPGIESFANAIGLMQLILPTAESMAKKDKEKVTREKLTDPDFNVKLGARYLAYVADHADAVLPLVPPGYNAGAGAIKRWIAARGELDLDLFVETIPFEEARGYTKRVVATWATYKYLYGKPAEVLPYVSQKLTRETKPAVAAEPPSL